MPTTVTDLAITYGRAWASHDPDGIAALHTADAVCHLHDVAEPFVGRDAIRA